LFLEGTIAADRRVKIQIVNGELNTYILFYTEKIGWSYKSSKNTLDIFVEFMKNFTYPKLKIKIRDIR